MSKKTRGIVALIAAIALPPLYFFSPLSRWSTFTTLGFPLVWLVAVVLSILAARWLSRWCYILTAILVLSFCFLFYVLASLP